MGLLKPRIAPNRAACLDPKDRVALVRLARPSQSPSREGMGRRYPTMDPAAKLLIGAFGSVFIMLGFVACWGTPEDRAEAARATIRNAPTACVLYMSQPKREPALDELCRAIALAEFDSDAIRSDEVPPAGTGSAVPTTPELPDGGVIHTEQGNGVRVVDGG